MKARSLLLLLIIIAAGLFLRLDAAWVGSAEDMPDSVGYQQIARGLSEEGLFSQKGVIGWAQPATNYSPGVPLLLGGLSYLGGIDSPQAWRMILAFLGSGGILAAFFLGRRLRGDMAGLLAAGIVAFYPTLISDSGMILSEGLGGALLASALLVALLARGRNALWLLAGALFALAALVRPDFLFLLFLLVPLFIWQGRSARPLLLFASALLLLAPWSAYASSQAGEFVPISTGGGQVLYTGSVSETGGDPQKISEIVLRENPDLLRHPVIRDNPSGLDEDLPADQVLHALALERHPNREPSSTLSKMGWAEYTSMLSQPATLLPFLGQKVKRTWLRGREALTGNPLGYILHLSIVFLALGALVFFRRSPDWPALAAVVLATTLFAAVFVASPRRVLAIWPIVAALSGGGAALLLAQLRSVYLQASGRLTRSRFAALRAYGGFFFGRDR